MRGAEGTRVTEGFMDEYLARIYQGMEGLLVGCSVRPQMLPTCQRHRAEVFAPHYVRR